jgi:sec-independent protein translocase protein TatA
VRRYTSETAMLGGISIWKLLIVLVIVILIFGTKRLKSIAGDLGGAAKNLKSALNDNDSVDDPVKPRKLENAEPDAEFPERKDRNGRA